MSEYALPCIVCGKVLFNVLPDYSENQPSKGVSAVIDGQYGSTVFDPMNGELLQVNICDPCLVKAGGLGQVHHGRTSKPVTISYMGVIGYEEVEYVPVMWRWDLPGFNDTCCIDEEDLDKLPKTIHLRFTVEEIKAALVEGDARAAKEIDKQ